MHRAINGDILRFPNCSPTVPDTGENAECPRLSAIGFLLFAAFPAMLLARNKRILTPKEKLDNSLKKNDLLSRTALAAGQRRGLSWQN
jgi:hypothetical protein